MNSKEFLLDNFDFRLDAEYFLKEYLEYLKKLKEVGYKKISEFSYVTDGIHTSIDYCDNSNVNLFSATTPRENYFDLSRQVFISEKAQNANPRTALKVNDVIISTVGTIGNCAVVNSDVLPANSDRHVGIIRIEKEFYPRYLSTFLLTKYGRFQTWRESTGNVQLNLFLYRIRTLKIANLTPAFQLQIENLVLLNDKKRKLSKETYSHAEVLVLHEIGFKKEITSLNPVKVTNSNVKSFKESFGVTGRLDAEYYQKKYEVVIEKIKSQKHDTLFSIAEINKSIEPGSNYYSDDETGLPFMRVADYNKFGLSKPNKRLTFDFVKDNQNKIDDLKPKKGTILFSKDGSVGTAYHLRADFNGVTSSAILHLKVRNEKEIIPEYLTLVLNSKLVQMQAERDAGGSIILHWRVGEIQNVIVPIINYKKQQEIAELIEESFSLKKQSEHLLEVAKKAVEIAIEENEEEAMRFINQNV